jgi:benzoyl-CoA reductase/2-hydroxyglutaryl-CoA dehydratase subunit BcrC/BadD/HgdB
VGEVADAPLLPRRKGPSAAKAAGAEVADTAPSAPRYRWGGGVDESRLDELSAGIRARASELIDHYLKVMRESPNRPDAMAWFDGRARIFHSERVAQIRRHKEGGGKVIGTMCMFAPLELIRAAGAIPVRLCSGMHNTIATGEEIMADAGLCPLVKSTLGVKLSRASPFFEAADAVVVPMVCDAKFKLGEVLQDFVPVWMVNVPHIKDTAQARALWLDEVRALQTRIEALTGNRIYWEELKREMELALRAQTVARRIYDIRKADPPVITGRDALLVTQTTFTEDLREWADRAEELAEELEERARRGLAVSDPEAPRVLLAGAPIMWPNFKLPQLVEESGGVIVADELCSGMRWLYDPIGVDEWVWDDMYRAMAERYLQPSVCPCFTPNDPRVGRIQQMIEDFRVEGVVYHVLRGCHIYNVEAARIKSAAEDMGVPMLVVETEYSQEDTEQLRTRIEAFLMLVRARRKKRAAAKRRAFRTLGDGREGGAPADGGAVAPKGGGSP